MNDDGGPESPSPGESATGSLDSTFYLIARVRAGDREALERLFARHLQPLQRWARGRLPKWARQLTDTDDLVQDALVQTFKRIDEFEPRRVGALQAYLRQAVLNRVRDEVRRKGRQPVTEADLELLEVENAASPLEEAIGREGVERYERALARLKPPERDIIIAKVELGYSYAELAEACDKPSTEAARKAAQRAIVRLADEMRRERQP
jgi:RNA polymerase sigma-70 factor, ECF subfamily